jgi:putative transposase
MRRIKLTFSGLYRHKHGIYRQTLWQKRFWDHIIRDERDLRHHIDYTHYNPVKHGFVDSPEKWPHSSYRAYRRLGLYPASWGAVKTVEHVSEYGE